MACDSSYHFEKNEELAFANLLNNLANDIISGRVRLIEADHERETTSVDDIWRKRELLTGRETLSIDFYRPSQKDN